MDYLHPLRTVIPGVQGRVLEALTRTDIPVTMRHLAQLAGVSQAQAATVLGALAESGIVQRRDVGRSSLVMLEQENVVARAIRELADARNLVVEDLRKAAKTIRPAPASLLIFGSFARGQAEEGSDLDVLAVRPDNGEGDDEWPSLWAWLDRAARVSGLFVNPVILRRRDVSEMSHDLHSDIERDAIMLSGQPLNRLAYA